MTVREVIQELTICECIIKELDEYSEKVDTIDHFSDSMRDAIEIIGKYMIELKSKQIK